MVPRAALPLSVSQKIVRSPCSGVRGQEGIRCSFCSRGAYGLGREGPVETFSFLDLGSDLRSSPDFGLAFHGARKVAGARVVALSVLPLPAQSPPVSHPASLLNAPKPVCPAVVTSEPSAWSQSPRESPPQFPGGLSSVFPTVDVRQRLVPRSQGTGRNSGESD